MRRAGRAALGSVLGLSLLVAGCGGGHPSPRKQVDDYIKSANEVVQGAALAFTRANRAYRRLTAGHLPPPSERRALRDAERAIRSTRFRVASLRPVPVQARRLRRRLLHLFDIDAQLAHQATQLAVYLPAAAAVQQPLARANNALVKGLRGSKGASGQEAVLSHYSAALHRVEQRLRGIHAPAVFARAQRRQIARLVATRKVLGQLRDAIKLQDAREIARVLLRFRKLHTGTTGTPALDRGALLAYQRRYQRLARAGRAIQHEEARLQRVLK